MVRPTIFTTRAPYFVQARVDTDTLQATVCINEGLSYPNRTVQEVFNVLPHDWLAHVTRPDRLDARPTKVVRVQYRLVSTRPDGALVPHGDWGPSWSELIDKARRLVAADPCQRCGVLVPHAEACGDQRLDADNDYFCGDCYGASLRVVAHWSTGDEDGVLDGYGHAGSEHERDFASVRFAGEDEPFVFDRVGTGGDVWVERVHGREVRLTFDGEGGAR